MLSKLKISGRDLATMLIVGATGGLTVASVFVAARFSSDPGDILGFFGGAIGAGLAVVGALWLDERRSNTTRERDRTMLSQALTQVALPCAMLHKLETAQEIMACALTFRQSVQAFGVVRQSVGITDALAYYSMASTIYWMDEVDKITEERMKAADSGQLTAEALKSDLLPRFDAIARTIRSTFGMHPFWKDAQSNLDDLVAAVQAHVASNQDSSAPRSSANPTPSRT